MSCSYHHRRGYKGQRWQMLIRILKRNDYVFLTKFFSIFFTTCILNYLKINWTTSAFFWLPMSRLKTVVAFNKSLYYKPNYRLRCNSSLTASYIGLPSSPSVSWVLFFFTSTFFVNLPSALLGVIPGKLDPTTDACTIFVVSRFSVSRTYRFLGSRTLHSAVIFVRILLIFFSDH